VSYSAPSADYSHSHTGAQPTHLATYTAGADDTYGFAFQDDRTIRAMIEATLLPIVVRMVKSTGKVVEAS
jgi:hypothetical protein